MKSIVKRGIIFSFFFACCFAESGLGIDSQGIATLETEQRLLAAEESTFSSASPVAAAAASSTAAAAAEKHTATLVASVASPGAGHPPGAAVRRSQSASEAGSQLEPETGGLRSQQKFDRHR